MNAEELKEMTEQAHKNKPTDDLSYEECVLWMSGFNSGWIAACEEAKAEDMKGD